MFTEIRFWPHYTMEEFLSMDKVHDIFPTGEADKRNWLLLSTSGVHGSYTTLDEVEASLNGTWREKYGSEDNNDGYYNGPTSITMLIIQPRLVVMHYGDIPVTLEDIPLIRNLVRTTLEAITESQEGNT